MARLVILPRPGCLAKLIIVWHPSIVHSTRSDTGWSASGGWKLSWYSLRADCEFLPENLNEVLTGLWMMSLDLAMKVILINLYSFQFEWTLGPCHVGKALLKQLGLYLSERIAVALRFTAHPPQWVGSVKSKCLDLWGWHSPVDKRISHPMRERFYNSSSASMSRWRGRS